MAHYSSVEYWNARYANIAGPFDWYTSYLATGAASSQQPTTSPSVVAQSSKRSGSATKQHKGSKEQAADPTTGAARGSTEFRENLLPLLTKGSRILVAGCGTSLLPEQLYDDGFQNIVAVDFSEPCVAYMEARRLGTLPAPEDEVQRSIASVPGLTPVSADSQGSGAARNGFLKVRQICYAVVNARSMPQFDTGSFDVVIDKAMIDAALCGVDIDKQKKHVEEILAELWRVLKPGGRLVHLTHTSSTDGLRAVVFESPVAKWGGVSMTKIRKSGVQDILSASESVQHHYMFCMVKAAQQ